MNGYVITIDTGTTNTRTILWSPSRECVSTANAPVGVRDTAIDGNNSRLKAAVKNCLDQLLTESSLTWDAVKCVIASGMITSNVGLVEIPHAIAPVGLDDLAQATKCVELPEVCPLPIWFIPGMKNSGGVITMDNLEEMDIMRGEEVESIAILEDFEKGTPILLILPGSHTKFISVDADGKMIGCLTSISGELLSCITNNTIIADAVAHKFVEIDSYDKELLLRGYQVSGDVGLGRACFSARIMNQFVTKEPDKIANFVLGAVLQNDVQAIKNSKALRCEPNTKVVVAGKNPLRQAIVDILLHDGYFTAVEEYTRNGSQPLSALGAYAVAKKRNIL